MSKKALFTSIAAFAGTASATFVGYVYMRAASKHDMNVANLTASMRRMSDTLNDPKFYKQAGPVQSIPLTMFRSMVKSVVRDMGEAKLGMTKAMVINDIIDLHNFIIDYLDHVQKFEQFPDMPQLNAGLGYSMAFKIIGRI